MVSIKGPAQNLFLHPPTNLMLAVQVSEDRRESTSPRQFDGTRWTAPPTGEKRGVVGTPP